MDGQTTCESCRAGHSCTKTTQTLCPGGSYSPDGGKSRFEKVFGRLLVLCNVAVTFVRRSHMLRLSEWNKMSSRIGDFHRVRVR